MLFESKSTQFISTYYFETKARDKDNYKCIVRIFAVGIIFPCATFIVFGYLVFFYSKWIAKFATKYITNGFDNKVNQEIKDNKVNQEIKAGKNIPMNNSKTRLVKKEATHPFHSKKAGSIENNNFEMKNKSDFENTSIDLSSKDQYNKRIRIVISLILVFAFLSFALLAFHIIASVKLIQYGNEVLYDDNDDQGYALRNDDQCVLIVYVVCSFMPTVSLTLFLIIVTIVLCIKSRSSQVDNTTDEALGLYLQFSLGGFLVYLGFYFLPYMVFAFIHDPFQSALVYMMLSSLILSICLFAYFLISVCVVGFLFYQKELSKWDSMSRLLTSGFTFASGLSITYFLTVLILIITLGNLHDFQGMENLTLSLFIALLSLFLLKPSLVHIKSFLEKSPTNDDSS